MKRKLVMLTILVFAFGLIGCAGQTEQTTEETTSVEEPAVSENTEAPADEVSVEDTLANADQVCADAGDAMAARQAETTLFERVGGRDGIHVMVVDTIGLHLQNEEIKHFFEPIDTDHLIIQVTDFLVVATGGEGEYNGRSMADAHAHLKLSNSEFLAAGADLRQAMENAEWGENEIQELHCAFLSLRAQVVAAAEPAEATETAEAPGAEETTEGE